jgi:hypothetical protein
MSISVTTEYYSTDLPSGLISHRLLGFSGKALILTFLRTVEVYATRGRAAFTVFEVALVALPDFTSRSHVAPSIQFTNILQNQLCKLLWPLQ